jgi:D-3-phosphoglycerate dehydrogenase
VEDLLSQVDFVTLHVPLLDATRSMINADRLRIMKPTATVLNFARDGIVDDAAVVAALDQGHLHTYVCDFPSNLLKGHERVITLPHLGASTAEAEDNCAIMVADQIKDYLENGNIRNSVNFPEVQMPRNEGHRLCVVNSNVPNMVGQISTTLAKGNLNIIDMLNKSRGDVAYTLVDVESEVSQQVVDTIAGIEGVLAVRAIQ